MDERKAYYCKLVFAFLAGALCCYALLCQRESAEIRQVRQQYENSAEQCRLLSNELTRSRERIELLEATIKASERGIDNAEAYVRTVQNGMRSDAEIIGECQQIIGELRKDLEKQGK